MNRNQTALTLALLPTIFALLMLSSGCSKTTDYTNYDLLVGKDWQLTSIDSAGLRLGDNCDFDDVLRFRDASSFTYDNGPCDRTVGTKEARSWKMTDDFTVLRLKYHFEFGDRRGSRVSGAFIEQWEVISITDTSLVLSDAMAEENDQMPRILGFRN